jgi:hydroxyacylglutathione hydrolase
MTDLQIHAYCGGLFQTNGYLVRAGERAWVFDAPEGIADWLEAEGLRPEALLLTHQHHDHVLDAARLRERFGCPVYAHSEPCEDLILSRRLESMLGMPCPIEEYSVEHRFEGLGSIDLGGLVLDLLHVPGHSPDSVCFKLRGAPVLIGGDVLFAGSIGRTDFPNGDHDLLLSGIRSKLWSLPDETDVLPGHGPTTTIGREKATNPYLA